MGSPDDVLGLTNREEGLVNRIMKKHPWTEEQLKDLNSLTLRLGDDPIRMAIVDILDARLRYDQLHSCKVGRDWRLIDGLAAMLRSGELYEELNGKITTERAESHMKGKDIPLSRWCGGHLVSANIMSLVRINSSVKELSNSIKVRNGSKTMSNPLVGNENITIVKGRVKIELDLGIGSERKKLLEDINSVTWRKKMDKELQNLPIWKVSVLHKGDEMELQTDGYDGYLAVDQVMRNMPHSCVLRSGQGSTQLIGSIRKLARRHPEVIRKSWELIGKTRRQPQEIALGVAEKIESGRNGKGLEWRLPLPEWMTDGLVKGSCADYSFSRWDSDDPEDPKYLKMKECHLGSDGPYSSND